MPGLGVGVKKSWSLVESSQEEQLSEKALNEHCQLSSVGHGPDTSIATTAMAKCSRDRQRPLGLNFDDSPF